MSSAPSHTFPIPSPSWSLCPGLGLLTQLSPASGTPSRSESATQSASGVPSEMQKLSAVQRVSPESQSQASPLLSASPSCWPTFATVGQLSRWSWKPSESVSRQFASRNGWLPASTPLSWVKARGSVAADTDQAETDIKDEIKFFDTALTLAGGLEYSLGGNTALVLAVIFDNGFADVIKHKDLAKLNVLNLRLGILF